MTGVEILNTEVIYNTIIPEFFIAIGCFGFIIFLIAAVCCLNRDRYAVSAVCFLLSICSIVCGILGSSDNKNSVHHLEHQVIIDESVSMTEFLGKYEIIDRAGKIYTVREKE